MKKVLMHKDTIVATFNYSQNNRVSSVQIKEPALFPMIYDSEINALRRWLISRKTAINRKDIAPVSGFYGTENYTSNSLRSMNDCYWIKDEEDNLTWNDISPYHYKDYESDGVFLSIVKPKDFEEFTPNSPNLTLSGKTPLFWYIKDNQLGLINADSQEDMQMYKIAKANNIDIFKEREYIILAGNIYTFVKTETSENIEKIPFDQLYFSTEDPSLSKSENLKKCCTYYKIPNWEDYIQKLLNYNKCNPENKIELLDIGVLRDTNTLEYIGFDYL